MRGAGDFVTPAFSIWDAPTQDSFLHDAPRGLPIPLRHLRDARSRPPGSQLNLTRLPVQVADELPAFMLVCCALCIKNPLMPSVAYLIHEFLRLLHHQFNFSQTHQSFRFLQLFLHCSLSLMSILIVLGILVKKNLWFLIFRQWLLFCQWLIQTMQWKSNWNCAGEINTTEQINHNSCRVHQRDACQGRA